MLSYWGAGRPGISGGFELSPFFMFKCLVPGKSSWVKRVEIPPTPSSSQKCIGKKEHQK